MVAVALVKKAASGYQVSRAERATLLRTAATLKTHSGAPSESDEPTMKRHSGLDLMSPGRPPPAVRLCQARRDIIKISQSNIRGAHETKMLGVYRTAKVLIYWKRPGK